MGIGDVTQPLAKCVVEAMHKAADEMGTKEEMCIRDSDDGTHQTGGNAPAGLERVMQLVVAAGKGDIVSLAELVAKVVAGAALQGLSLIHI